MKVTVNGTISKEALKVILETQKAKSQIIDEFCKENKITSFHYKDSELEPTGCTPTACRRGWRWTSAAA